MKMDDKTETCPDCGSPLEGMSETGSGSCPMCGGEDVEGESKPEKDEIPVDETMISSRIQQGRAWSSTQVQSTVDDLEFYGGDTQWDGVAQENRVDLEGNMRPMLVTHALRPYVNRVLNPIRMHPFGIKVMPKQMRKEEDPNGLVKKAYEIVKGVVRSIELRSRASDAYERAAENQVIGGLGFVHVTTEYESEDGWDLEIKIEQVDDVSCVVLDPFSVKEDGSDAKWGAIIKAVPDTEAREAQEEDDAVPSTANIWTGWFPAPANCVWEMVYYEKVEMPVTLYRLADGKSVTKVTPGMVVERSRKSTETKVRCIKFVGNTRTDSVVLPISYIPLVPAVGERIQSKDRRYAGMVHWVRNLVQLSNFYLSTEAEVAGQAPRGAWIMAEGQDEGHEAEWDEKVPVAVKHYRPMSHESGQPIPQPNRVPTTADTGSMIQSRQAIISTLGQTLGISDNMLGQMEAGAESGTAVFGRVSTGEIATAHYSENLSKTVAQVGRVVVQLIQHAYKGEREVEIVDDNGQAVIQTVDVGAMMEALGRIDVDSDAGPSFASARRESVSTLMALGQTMPDKMPIMADIIANNSDAPGADVIARRFAKMLPPELKEEEPGVPSGEAKAALDAADQTIQAQQQMIDELKAIMGQMQSQIIDNAKDRQTDMLKAILDNRTKLAIETMKQDGLDGRTAATLAAEQDKQLSDLAHKLMGNVMSSTYQPRPYELGDSVPPAPGPVNPQVEGVQQTLDLIEQATNQGVDPGTMQG